MRACDTIAQVEGYNRALANAQAPGARLRESQGSDWILAGEAWENYDGLDTAAAEWTLLDNCLHLLAYERVHRGAGEALATRIMARIADLDLRWAALTPSLWARVPRYYKFESISLQRRVGRTGLEPAAPRIEWAEHGSEVEVNAGDQVILQPPANLENGEKVQIALGTPAATPSIR